LSIEEAQVELNLRYERIRNNHSTVNIVDHAYYRGTRFKGKCHWCGKFGHKSTKCRQRISGKPKVNESGKELNNDTNKFSNYSNYNNHNNKNNNRKYMNCTYCHKKGHEEHECCLKKREQNPSDSVNVVK
jgi:hypothetical protein